MRTIVLIFILAGVSNLFGQNKAAFAGGINTSSVIQRWDQDSLTINENEPTHLRGHSFINTVGQGIVGASLEIVFPILPAAANFASAWNGGNKFSEVTLGLLTYSSIIFGSAVGVYWVAQAENDNLSFWGTVGYTAIGGGVGAVLAAGLATQYATIPNGWVVVVALCPLAGAMIYTGAIADWDKEVQSYNPELFSKYPLHQKIIERSQLINIKIIDITF